MKEKSFVRIEIPERIEQLQLIAYITKLPEEQFKEIYREILGVFNLEVIQQLIETEKETWYRPRMVHMAVKESELLPYTMSYNISALQFYLS